MTSLDAFSELERRLRDLGADAPARWGRMDACAMVRHLRATVELSLGEVRATALVPVWIGAPTGWIFTTLLTRWPRNLGGRLAPLPALHPQGRAPFETERERLLATLRRFGERCRAEPHARARHPVFGDLTLARWARVHELHFAHHLRQFGA